jgi:hypothetical protein
MALLAGVTRGYEFDISVHAFQEMLDDDISVDMLVSAIGYDRPHICEDYELDERGASCLILGYGLDDVPMHIVVAYHTPRPIVVTAYKNPSREIWEEDLCTRRRDRAT